jgi:hypothetical protein
MRNARDSGTREHGCGLRAEARKFSDGMSIHRTAAVHAPVHCNGWAVDCTWGSAFSWLSDSRRQAQILLAGNLACLRCLTFELSCPRRQVL